MKKGIAISRRELSLSVADEVAGAAVEAAQREGIRICVVVVDTAGLPLSQKRMNGVNEAFFAAANDKAWTSANFRRPTSALRERMASDELKAGAASRARLLLWGGGIPIIDDGECLGAIGVSGALVAQDIACAEAALKTCGFKID